MSELTGSLRGRRVLNTRAVHQAAELDALLSARGALPLAYPCIRIESPQDCTALDEALREAVAGGFDWLLLTSANAVHAIALRLAALGLGALPADLHVAAIGSGTAQAAEHQLRRLAELVPDSARAEALLAVFPQRSGLRVLLPQAELARPLLAQELAERACVVSPVAYRTLVGSGGVDLRTLLAAGRVDAVALTSPSTARNLVVRLGPDEGSLRALAALPAACIGPLTVDAAAQLGAPIVEAREHSLPGLVDALETYFSTLAV
jgi:uroporphyrinogen-III synthase